MQVVGGERGSVVKCWVGRFFTHPSPTVVLVVTFSVNQRVDNLPYLIISQSLKNENWKNHNKDY